MKFYNIIANPPYSKIGCDITKKIIEYNPNSNYAMLGTRSMFKPFYADTLACAFVQIGRCELGTNKKLDWGVEQATLLATNGWTEVEDNRKKCGENKVGIAAGGSHHYGYVHTRMTHLVGMGIAAINPQAYTDLRTSQLVQSDNQKSTLRNGYIYVSFDSFEEACECAIDIISWKNPTDSHYKCVKWGFVCGLIPHYK